MELTNEIYDRICDRCRDAGMCYPSREFAEVIFNAINEVSDEDVDVAQWRETCAGQKRAEHPWEF